MEPAIRGARTQSGIAAAGLRSRITAAQNPEYGFKCAGLRAQSRPPGTEFLDAETRRQKSPLKRANAHRDQNPRNEWPEIPAETPYLASSPKCAVCEGWVVGAVGLELETHHPVIEPVSALRRERKFSMRRRRAKSPFSLTGDGYGDKGTRKRPHFAGKCEDNPPSSIPEDWVVGAPGLEPGTR